VICPAPTSASAQTNCLVAVPDVLGGVSATDSCSGPTGHFGQSRRPESLVGLGVHTITGHGDGCGDQQRHLPTTLHGDRRDRRNGHLPGATSAKRAD